MAYLHNLKPPLVHRDIKPANVLVAEETHITRLCDLGLSRLKSSQSLSQTASIAIPGTPSYMAPECLLERKKASVHSNVWSLACTLIELFTEKDCWGQLQDDSNSNSEDRSADLDMGINSLRAAMKRKKYPSSKDLLPNTSGAALYGILLECFHFDISSRACSIDIVNAFQ